MRKRFDFEGNTYIGDEKEAMERYHFELIRHAKENSEIPFPENFAEWLDMSYEKAKDRNA